MDYSMDCLEIMVFQGKSKGTSEPRNINKYFKGKP